MNPVHWTVEKSLTVVWFTCATPLPPLRRSCWSNVACASPAPAASASVASAALSAPPLAAAVPSAKGSASGLDNDDTPDSVMALEMIRSYMAANNLSAPVNGVFQPAS